jgi:hypothetical protein
LLGGVPGSDRFPEALREIDDAPKALIGGGERGMLLVAGDRDASDVATAASFISNVSAATETVGASSILAPEHGRGTYLAIEFRDPL